MQSYWSSESAKLEQPVKCDSTASLPENNGNSDRPYLGMKSNGFIDEDYVTNGSTVEPISFVRSQYVSNHENGDSRSEETTSFKEIRSKHPLPIDEKPEAENAFSVILGYDLCDTCGELYIPHHSHNCELDETLFSKLQQTSIENRISSHVRRRSYQLEEERFPQAEEHSETSQPTQSLCPYCYGVFESHELADHISVHSNLAYICERCGVFFSEEEELQQHEKKHGDTVLCMNCFKVCDDDVDLVMHTTVRMLPLECQQCKEQFQSHCAMHSHRASCSPKKKMCNNVNSMKVKCSQCPMVFATQQRLDDHFRQHTGERPFFCDHCLQTYSRKDNLNRHLRKNRIEDGLTCKCNLCHLEFPSKCSLKKHYTTEHPETFADQCMKVLCIAEPSEHTVLNGRSLRSRIQSNEPNITPPESVPQPQVTEESSSDVKAASSNVVESIRFSCDLCSKTFGYRKSLSKHVRSIHSQDKLPHACHLCDRSFPDIMLLNRHVNWHKGAQHQCRECGICYSHSKHLLRHLKKVHAIKNTDSKVQFESKVKISASESMTIESADTLDSIQSKNESFDANTHVKSELVSREENVQSSSCGGNAERATKTVASALMNGVTTITTTNTASPTVKYLTYAELLKLVENAPKPFTCQVCGKPTDSKRNYLEHYMSHSKERPFKCDVCGQGFIRERRMLDHKVIHERCIKKPRFEEMSEDMSYCVPVVLDDEEFTRSYPDSFYARKELRPCLDDSAYLARFPHLSFRTPSIDLNRFDLYPATSEGLVQSSSSMVHFRCDNCTRVFSRRSALVSHQKICVGDRPASAEIPRARRSKPFKYLQSFEREDKIVVYGMEHSINTVNGEQRFTCGVCGRSFDKKNFIFKHTLIHVKDKPFKCALCMNRGFMTRNSLKKHFRKCHKGLTIDKDGNVINKDNNISAALPGVVWTESPSSNNSQISSLLQDRLTQGYSENHASKSPEHITVECDLNDMMSMFEPEIDIVNQNIQIAGPAVPTFDQSTYPVHTIFIAQPMDTGGHVPVDVEMPFVDNYPNYQLNDVSMNHFLESNDVDMEDVSTASQSTNGSVPEDTFLTCGQCNTSFETKEEMYKHYVAHDMANDPIKCATCDKEFVRRQYLQMHAMMHARPKRFQCTFCNKSFRAKRDMDDHVRTHTGEKPFACEHCDRKFRVRKQLYAHRKSHVQPFQCSKCSASFSIEWSLKRHEKLCNNQESRKTTSINDDVTCKKENVVIRQEFPDTILPDMNAITNEGTETM